MVVKIRICRDSTCADLLLYISLMDIKALCPSVFICARMYAVNQGFVTSEAKGAHVGRRYPTMQILLKKFFTMYEADLLKQEQHLRWLAF